MADQTLARRYASAIFSLAQESNSVEQVGSDLDTLCDAITSDEATHRFFVSPVIERKEKERVLEASFGGKISEIALHTLLLLVRKRREALLQEIVTQYQALQQEASGLEPLTITTAQALSAEQARTLVSRLEQVYKKKFDVTQQVDSNLIGGVRIMMGDRLIDGTVAGRLDDLTRNLFANN